MDSLHATKTQNTNSIGIDSRTVLLGNGSGALNPSQESRINHTKSRFVWTFEVFCATLSCASLAAIIALLNYYDGEPLSEWALRIGSGPDSIFISLNFVVSILSTLAKSTSAVVLSSCLSQLKWNWFSSRQLPLGDFQTFDDASRGPKGSVELLLKTKARRLASIGALLTVLSLAFDPFAQLLITYRGDVYQIPSDANTMAYAQRYVQGSQVENNGVVSMTYEGLDVSSSTTTLYPEMVAAIYNGIWNRRTRLEPNYECNNGNCTWQPYVSLAICSSCFDISSFVSENTQYNISCGYSGQFSTFVVPSGSEHRLEPQYNISWSTDCAAKGMDIRSTAAPNETINFQNSQTLLFSAAILNVSNSTDAPSRGDAITATECGLQLCSNTYYSMVENGQFSEALIASASQRVRESWRFLPDQEALPDRNDSWNPAFSNLVYILRDDFQVELSSDQRDIANVSAFNISQGAIDSTTDYLLNLMPNSENRDFSHTVIEELGIPEYAFPVAQAIYNSPSLDTIFENIAADMSVAIRNAGSLSSEGSVATPDNSQPEYSLSPLTGISQVYVITISIRWAFIALPVAICLLSFMYLVAAIIQTSKLAVPAWKDNALAGLVWGLDPETKEVARTTWVKLGTNEARKITVRFRGSKNVGDLISTN